MFKKKKRLKKRWLDVTDNDLRIAGVYLNYVGDCINPDKT